MHRRGFLTLPLLTLPWAPARAAATLPVVLELFTSQGCSSCPPADALLGKLIHTPGIIGLAWHVDYWNSLGWRDPYARPEWTERQKSYAKTLDGDVFTPALVVNGAALVVGSDERAVQNAIERAVPPPVSVTLNRFSAGIDATIAAVPPGTSALLAIYDPEQTTQVAAGENDGRRLREYRIVREVRPLSDLASRMTLLPVPDNRGAVLLLRNAASHVIGAADLPPAEMG